MRDLLILMTASALGACAGADAPAADPAAIDDVRARAVVATTATPASADDAIVARVAGRPIYGSCVAAQVTRGARTAHAALDECLEFELLAMAAEARGLAADLEVIEATRTALVNRLVAREFETTYAAPASMQRELETVLARDPRPTEQPERRGSAYARIDVAKGAPPETVTAARVVADALAAEVVGSPGLMLGHLKAAGEQHTAGTAWKLTTADVKPMAKDRMDPGYADALFGLRDIGTAAGPVRTAWGWDVVLLASIEPAFTLTREIRIDELFPQLRRQQFNLWVQQRARAQGIQVELDAKQVSGILTAAEGS